MIRKRDKQTLQHNTFSDTVLALSLVYLGFLMVIMLTRGCWLVFCQEQHASVVFITCSTYIVQCCHQGCSLYQRPRSTVKIIQVLCNISYARKLFYQGIQTPRRRFSLKTEGKSRGLRQISMCFVTILIRHSCL